VYTGAVGRSPASAPAVQRGGLLDRVGSSAQPVLAGAAALGILCLIGRVLQHHLLHVLGGLVLRGIHAGQCRSHPPEQLLHIVAGLSARLNEHHVQLLRLSLTLLGGHLPLVREIRLVADQHDDDVAAPLCAHVIDPLGGLVERVGVGDVVHDHGHRRVSNVRGYQRAEPLLARRVPQLQTHGAILQVHGLREEVNSDRRLVRVVEAVVHEASDQRGFPHALLAQEDQLELPQRIAKISG